MPKKEHFFTIWVRESTKSCLLAFDFFLGVWGHCLLAALKRMRVALRCV
jgi:hypothetical protein